MRLEVAPRWAMASGVVQMILSNGGPTEEVVDRDLA